MTDTKVSGLTNLNAIPSSDDFLMIVDKSDTTFGTAGTNKYIEAKYFLNTNGTQNTFGTISGTQLALGAANSLQIGAFNEDTYLSIAGVRAYLGYQASTNSFIWQGGVGKKLVFATNNATFGSGTVAVMDTSGNWTLNGNQTVNGTVQATLLGENWSNLSFLGTWANFGGSYSTGKYKKYGDEVILTGMIKGNSGTIATLPAGYRPAGYIRLGGIHTNTGNDGVIEIRTNGDMLYLAGGTVLFSLAGLRFTTSS